MKLSTESKALKTALTTMSKVVRNQATLPALTYVKLEAAEGSVKLTGTDLDTWASVELPAHLEGEGSALVSLRSLRDALKRIPSKRGHHVELELDELASDTSNPPQTQCLSIMGISIPTMPLDEYPQRGQLNGSTHAWDWFAGETALRRALVAASCDTNRYYLSAIQIAGRHLNSTDGHRLMRVENPASEPTDPILVPLQLASLTARIAKTSPHIEWSVDDSFIQTRVGSWTFLSRRPDGTFPDTDKVMPNATGNHLFCNRVDLLNALETILPFTNERSHCVALAIDESALHLESTGDNGQATAKVSASVSGSPIKIGFNAEYLIDPLKQSDAETVEFKWTDDKGVAELTAEDWRYVVMPMRLS